MANYTLAVDWVGTSPIGLCWRCALDAPVAVRAIYRGGGDQRCMHRTRVRQWGGRRPISCWGNSREGRRKRPHLLALPSEVDGGGQAGPPPARLRAAR